MNVGSLEIELLANMARLQADMDRAKSVVASGARAMEDAAQRVKEALGGMAAGLSVAAFMAGVRGAIDAADALNDLSKSTDIAVEKLAGLKLAATQSGSNLDGTAKAINKLQVEIGKDADKFAKIGITAKDGLGAFKELADIYRAITDPQLRAAVAAEALGKSWAESAPLLAEGGDKIQEMVDKGARLSGMTQGAADASDEFNDRIAELHTAMGALTLRTAVDVLPLITALAEGMTTTAEEVGGLDHSFSPLTETLRAVMVVGGNVAFVLKGIGTELGGLAATAAAVARGDFAGASEIHRAMMADAAKARSEFDAWEKKIMEAGKTAKAASQDAASGVKELSDAQKKALEQFASNEAAKRAKEAADAARRAAEEFDRLWAKLTGKEIGVDADFSKNIDTLQAGLAAGRITLDEYVNAVQRYMAQQPYAVAAAKAMAAAYLEQVAAQEELAAAMVAESKAREQGRLSVDAWVQAQDEAIAQQRLEQQLFGASERNRAIALDQYRIELDLKKQLAAVDANLAFDEAQRDEERARLRAAADRAKAAAVTKADMQELQSLWASFDSTAHDVFVNIFNDGSNAFTKLGQSLKAGLIDVLYQLTLKRWIINIGASITGGSLAGSASAATGGLGDIGSLISGAGSLGTVGSTVAGWMGLGGATAAGMAANVGIGTAAGLTVAEATAAASAAGAAAGSGLMTTLGPLMSAAPYLAAIAGVYMLAKQLDHSGTPHIGGGSQYSAAGGLLDARSSTFASGFTGIAYSDSTTQMTAGVVQSIVGILDSTAQAFGKTAGYTAAASFADDSSKDGAWGSLRIADAVGNVLADWQAGGVSFRTFSDGSAGSAEYLAAISADVRKALDGIDVPDWARAMITKLGDAPSLDQLAATVAQITQVQNAITAQRAGLQQQYDLLAGVTTQRELERAALDESNRALYDQIQALQDQKDAADKAAQAEQAAAQAAAQQRATLQDQLDALVLTPEQLLAKQRAALDESNRALFDQVQAATAARDAQQALADAQAQLAEQARAAAEALIERARTSAASLLDYQRAVARIRDAQAATLGGAVAASSGAAAVVVAPVSSGSAVASQSAGVVEAVTALRADFAAQMEGLRAETRAIVKTTGTTASILTRVTPNEDGISTYTVN